MPYSEIMDKMDADIRNSVERVLNTWLRMGYPHEEIVARFEIMQEHRTRLHNEFETEATEQCEQLSKEIDLLTHTISDLETKLHECIPNNIDNNLPLFQRRNDLERLANRYSNKLKCIQKQTADLNEKAKRLLECLGRPLPQLLNDVESEEKISTFSAMLNDLADEAHRRNEEYFKYHMRIKDMVNELGYIARLDSERAILQADAPLITDGHLESLVEFHDQLNRLYLQTEQHIADCREKVNNLWDILEENVTVRSDFLRRNQGNSLAVLDALKHEIKRCEQLKRQNIKRFVDKIREQIQEMWTNCHFGPATKRKEFPEIECDSYSDDLLLLHEIYLNRLQRYYNDNSNFYQLLDKRKQLWQKKERLEQQANNPDRYKNRGGQLLKEEKERRQVDINLPQVEQELCELATNFEKRSGKAVRVNDQPIDQIIQAQWDAFNSTKAEILSAKKQANTPMMPSTSVLSAKKSTVKRKLLAATPEPTNASNKKRRTPKLTPSSVSVRYAHVQSKVNSNLKKPVTYAKPAQPKLLSAVTKRKKVVLNLKRRFSLNASSASNRNNRTRKSIEPNDIPEENVQSDDEYSSFSENIHNREDCRSSMAPIPALLINDQPMVTTPLRPKQQPAATVFHMDL